MWPPALTDLSTYIDDNIHYIYIFFVSIVYFSDEYQTFAWTILQQSISNLIQQVTSEDKAREIAKKILRLNIMRGKGLICKYIMAVQLSSTDKTHIYALFISLIYLEVGSYSFFDKVEFVISLSWYF